MCDRLEQRRQRFIEMARKRHGDRYDYSLVQFNNQKHCKVKIICPTHGQFDQLASTHIAKRRNQDGYMGCRKCATESRPRRQLCVDCGCWNKYGGTDKRCKDCKAKYKRQKAEKQEYGRYCRQCGKPTLSRHRLFCSSECRVAKNRVVIQCGYCKADIAKRSHHVKRSSKLFCNPECQRLAQIGVYKTSPLARSLQAKKEWRRLHSAKRRLKSVRFQWWKLCSRDWFSIDSRSVWHRRCVSAASGLSNRRKPFKTTIAKALLTWPQALQRARTKLQRAAKRLEKDAWTKRIENQVGHLRRRRAVKNERKKG